MFRYAATVLASFGLLAVPMVTRANQFSVSSQDSKSRPEAQSASVKRTVSDDTSAAAAATASQVTGTFVAKFTIKLATPLPSGSEVLCGLIASVEDENTSSFSINNSIQEGASSKATVSGSTATCTVTIPYSWYLAYASTDTVDLGYSLYYINPTATNQFGQSRYSSQYVPGAGAIKVPATGTTTTYTISATL